MNPFEMVVLIVALVCVARVLQAKYRGTAGHGEPGDSPLAAFGDHDVRRLREDVKALRERVAVLERIVTDGDRERGLALEREIDALRHQA